MRERGSIIERVRRLYPYAYSVAGSGNDEAVSAFLQELPFTVREYPAGAEKNGWIISRGCRVMRAEIRRGGVLVYDGKKSPLGVPSLCPPFSGRVSLKDLKTHLWFSEAMPDAVPYNWSALYRPSERVWGFCVPKALYDTLEPGEYEVNIVTEEVSTSMKVLDFVLPGKTPHTVLFNAHNCHAFQANDDISGCAVGIEVIRRLAELPERRFTYRLVIAPELIGTVFWLDDVEQDAKDFVGAVLFKSVGNAAPLKLQDSFTGTAQIDRAAHHEFHHRFHRGNYLTGPFRTIYGNDETVFEAPGFQIPTISMTRVPFAEYHTDADTPDRLSEEKLEEVADISVAICRHLEADRPYRGRVKGLVALSHPRYNLYQPAPAPGLDRTTVGERQVRWNLLMNCLPRLLDGQTGLLEIADRFDIYLPEVRAYVERWVERSLAEPA